MKTLIKTMLFFIVCCFVAQPATSQVSARDPNEPVADDRDFKETRVSYNKATSEIDAYIAFYQPPNFGAGQFAFYISTEGDYFPEYHIRCSMSSFKVHEHNSGVTGRLIYTGTPTINQSTYNLKIPLKALGLLTDSNTQIGMIRFWFAVTGADPDRFPDSGTIDLNFKY